MTITARERILDSLNGGDNGPPETKPETELKMEPTLLSAIYSATRRLYARARGVNTLGPSFYYVYKTEDGGAKIVETGAEVIGRAFVVVYLKSVEVWSYNPSREWSYQLEKTLENQYGLSLINARAKVQA